MRFLQLLNGIFVYFMTGRPSFQLKLSFSKEGELKIPEFYHRIIDNFENFEEFYSTTSFKKVENFNAEYIISHKNEFNQSFQLVVDFEYVDFLLEKLSTDWELKRKGVRTDTTGAEVPILGYENLATINYMVGLLEMNKLYEQKKQRKKSQNQNENEKNEENGGPFGTGKPEDIDGNNVENKKTAENANSSVLNTLDDEEVDKFLVQNNAKMVKIVKNFYQIATVSPLFYLFISHLLTFLTFIQDIFEKLKFHNKFHNSYVFLVSLLIKSEPESPLFQILLEGNNFLKNLSHWIKPEYCQSRLFNKKLKNRNSTCKAKAGNYGHLRIFGNLIAKLEPEKKKLLTMCKYF